MKRNFTLVLSLFICLVGFSQNTIFSTGFEGATFDEGWTTGMSTNIEETPYDYPGGIDPWEEWAIYNDNPTYVHSGNSAAFMGGTLNLEDKYDWLMTPEFLVPTNTTTNINYWMWYQSSTPSYWTWLYIMVYDVNEDIWEIGELIFHEENVSLSYIEEYAFNLDPWEGKDVKVAFVKRGTYQFAMDDISCISVQNGNDMALNAIVTPNNENGCTLTDEEEVTVIVENLGTTDISTFDILYSINSDVFVTETVNEGINAGETMEYTFNERADLSEFGGYIINVEVMVDDDQNLPNNLLTSNVVSMDAVIRIEMLTDKWGTVDNFFDVIDSEGNIVASVNVGELPKEELYTLDVCVISTECYTFSLYDAFGDGISGDGGAPGYLKVYYNGDLVGGFSEYEANFGSEFIIEEIGDCTVNVKSLNQKIVMAYPNPVNNILFLENIDEVQSVTIVDMLGREYIQQVEGSVDRVAIDFSSYENGVYLVKINSKDNEYNTVLIQK